MFLRLIKGLWLLPRWTRLHPNVSLALLSASWGQRPLAESWIRFLFWETSWKKAIS